MHAEPEESRHPVSPVSPKVSKQMAGHWRAGATLNSNNEKLPVKYHLFIPSFTNVCNLFLSNNFFFKKSSA